jgi:D-3-phosphoglycerate dehydrogenase
MEARRTMNRLKILNAESEDYSRDAYVILSSIGDVTEANLSQQQVLEMIKDYHVLIVRLGTKVNKEIIDKATELKYILTATTGNDHIDVKYAHEKGIEIISLKGETQFLENIPSTAEHTWALLLASLRKLPAANNYVLQGGWNRQIFRGHNLKGKKLGILGLGRVGKQVAAFANAFGCITSAYDPYLEIWPDENVTQYHSAEELLGWNDILCIHIPYDSGNEHFLNLSLLSHLKHGAIVINTSRSGIWDESAIVQLLESGHISAVATDVIDNEQNENARSNGLLLNYAKAHDNVIITPHIAGATYESMHMTEVFIANKLNRSINSHVRN